MSGFFFICEFLNITPQEFFDIDSAQPKELRALTNNLKRLDTKQLEHISAIVEALAQNK